jgi:flagellar biosynthesis anti-sigma factor FlgM
MKINPILNPNILRGYQASKTAPERTKATSGRDEVTFSAEALSFSKAMAAAKDAIEFRTAEERSHIADIKQAIRQGTYNVESEKVAEKILESVRGLK